MTIARPRRRRLRLLDGALRKLLRAVRVRKAQGSWRREPSDFATAASVFVPTRRCARDQLLVRVRAICATASIRSHPTRPDFLAELSLVSRGRAGGKDRRQSPTRTLSAQGIGASAYRRRQARA